MRPHLKGLYGGLHFTLALAYYYLRRRSPGPPFPPDHAVRQGNGGLKPTTYRAPVPYRFLILPNYPPMFNTKTLTRKVAHRPTKELPRAPPQLAARRGVVLVGCDEALRLAIEVAVGAAHDDVEQAVAPRCHRRT
jgi:hypothetical protein